jgi:putative phosphoesterase
MLIGIISDSHDHEPHIKQAVAIFKKRKADVVIHAGDYCSPFTIPHFRGLPLQGILGNNDGDCYLLMQKFGEINAHLHGTFFELDVDDRLLAVYHGTDQPITDALRACGKYDIVISGHTHEVVDREMDGTLALNPGTAHGFGETATVAFWDSDGMEAEFVELG